MTQNQNFASPAASACLKESLLFGLPLRPANSERVTFHNQTTAQELCPNASAGNRNPGRNLNPVTDSPGEMLTPSRCPRSSSEKLPAHSTKFHRKPPVISHFSPFFTSAFHVEFPRLPTPFRHPSGWNTASLKKCCAPCPSAHFSPVYRWFLQIIGFPFSPSPARFSEPTFQLKSPPLPTRCRTSPRCVLPLTKFTAQRCRMLISAPYIAAFYNLSVFPSAPHSVLPTPRFPSARLLQKLHPPRLRAHLQPPNCSLSEKRAIRHRCCLAASPHLKPLPQEKPVAKSPK